MPRPLRILTLLALTGCAVESTDGWEEFREAATREYEGHTFYVVEWDRAMTLDQLYEYYLAQRGGTASQASTVDHGASGDAVWPSLVAQHLSYCISNDFGTDKQRAVDEMAAATRAWEAEANVNFEYAPQHDADCTGGNLAVRIPVRPWTIPGACAFGPPGSTLTPCIPRVLVMNFQSFDNPASQNQVPNLTTTGVFRHELGHVLGLRHEHIRGHVCSHENNQFRALTPYDPLSVMHYPQCGGYMTTDWLLTNFDADGIRQLYGASLAPTEVQFHVADVDDNDRADIVQYRRSWTTLPTCRSVDNGSGGTRFDCSTPAATVFDSGDPAQQLLVGDFNGDQRADTVQAFRRFGSYPTCTSTLAGGWACSNPAATIFNHADDTSVQRFLVGKFDSDTRDDIVQVYRKFSSIPLCTATAAGGWSCNNGPATIFDSGSDEQQFLVGEVDDIGPHFDDVIQTFRGWGSIPVCRSNGSGGWVCGNFSATIRNSGSYEQRFATGDFNGDGMTDVIQLFRGWANSMPLCSATPNVFGAFVGWTCTDAPAQVFDSGSFEQQFLTGDFNGDGKTDVVQTYRGWSSLPLCLSTGTGWSCSNPSATIFNSGSREQRFLAADVDNDGRTDVIQVFRGWSSYPVCFSRVTGWDCQNLPATVLQ